jgi:rhodanese-related sulfurtransferase
LLEGLAVAAVGALLAFGANALSPRGLKLSRDYFGSRPAPAIQDGRLRTNAQAFAALAARLGTEGLRIADSKEADRLFHDPGYQQDRVIFLDARDDAHYQAGHIPGAYQFDRYYPEKYLTALLPLCQAAEQIIVYCNGGDCEDSEQAALFLASGGVNREKLLVYAGGITEWERNGWPIEAGARGSGERRK